MNGLERRQLPRASLTCMLHATPQVSPLTERVQAGAHIARVYHCPPHCPQQSVSPSAQGFPQCHGPLAEGQIWISEISFCFYHGKEVRVGGHWWQRDGTHMYSPKFPASPCSQSLQCGAPSLLQPSLGTAN